MIDYYEGKHDGTYYNLRQIGEKFEVSRQYVSYLFKTNGIQLRANKDTLLKSVLLPERMFEFYQEHRNKIKDGFKALEKNPQLFDRNLLGIREKKIPRSLEYDNEVINLMQNFKCSFSQLYRSAIEVIILSSDEYLPYRKELNWSKKDIQLMNGEKKKVSFCIPNYLFQQFCKLKKTKNNGLKNCLTGFYRKIINDAINCDLADPVDYFVKLPSSKIFTTVVSYWVSCEYSEYQNLIDVVDKYRNINPQIKISHVLTAGINRYLSIGDFSDFPGNDIEKKEFNPAISSIWQELCSDVSIDSICSSYSLDKRTIYGYLKKEGYIV
ncbi:MAG: hypothetical protein ACRC78_01545 [Planktothrix sp.]